MNAVGSCESRFILICRNGGCAETACEQGMRQRAAETIRNGVRVEEADDFYEPVEEPELKKARKADAEDDATCAWEQATQAIPLVADAGKPMTADCGRKTIETFRPRRS